MDAKKFTRISYTCGYCNKSVGPDTGYYCGDSRARVYARILICPTCNYPTFQNEDRQVPGVSFGDLVPDITDKEVAQLYDEARSALAVRAFTASVMACRKILMNVAVKKGAAENLKFIDYVNHLEARNYMPPDARSWVDAIRRVGNTATHEIKLMKSEDAQMIIRFTEMLLRFIYELPAILRRAQPKAK
jgi:hypothetical protein